MNCAFAPDDRLDERYAITKAAPEKTSSRSKILKTKDVYPKILKTKMLHVTS